MMVTSKAKSSRSTQAPNDKRPVSTPPKNGSRVEPSPSAAIPAAAASDGQTAWKKTAVERPKPLKRPKLISPLAARMQQDLQLLTVLSIEETHQLLDAIRLPCHQAFFWTVYSMGLRMQEALNLQVVDIDSKRMLVHVRRGKGHKDRLIPLPPNTLQRMRQYWSTHRNPLWIFPYEGRDRKQAATSNQPMSDSTPQGQRCEAFLSVTCVDAGGTPANRCAGVPPAHAKTSFFAS